MIKRTHTARIIGIIGRVCCPRGKGERLWATMLFHYIDYCAAPCARAPEAILERRVMQHEYVAVLPTTMSHI